MHTRKANKINLDGFLGVLLRTLCGRLSWGLVLVMERAQVCFGNCHEVNEMTLEMPSRLDLSMLMSLNLKLVFIDINTDVIFSVT